MAEILKGKVSDLLDASAANAIDNNK